MIASIIPGRVRIRDARFTDPDLSATATALLREYPGIQRVTANLSTGSLLIEYDPERLDPEAAQQALAQIDPEGAQWLEERSRGGPEQDGPEAAGPLAGIDREAWEYLAMTAAFVICTGSAVLRSKGLHIYSGLSLAGMTIGHMFKYRRQLAGRFKNLAGE